MTVGELWDKWADEDNAFVVLDFNENFDFVTLFDNREEEHFHDEPAADVRAREIDRIFLNATRKGLGATAFMEVYVTKVEG